ncbi:heat shock transcription factor, X-linked-like [Alosa alosa]|uniref:heat shock transcription factor, X-linked-like n=1 Tax=Alosa alosa TaxID=278164 RepID=UPI0020150E38|nr:heat shock transcription factor, X-linked-like [Alosa alosa]
MMFIAEILERDVIDCKFGTKSIKNFYRQLKLYGFTRPGVNLENHENLSMDVTAKKVKVFANPYFQRGCENLLAQLKRHVRTKATETSPVADAEICKASGHGCKLTDEMVSPTSRRPAIQCHDRTLLGPSRGLSLMLAALESKRRALMDFLRMNSVNSAGPSTSGDINSISGTHEANNNPHSFNKSTELLYVYDSLHHSELQLHYIVR